MSVNKVILIGRLGKDPEVRYSQSGVAICTISLATSRNYKDKTGEKKEETEWHRVTFYDKLADVAGKYLKKGDQCYVEGRIKYGKYTDKENVERYTTDIIVEQMTLLGGSKGNEGDGESHAHAQPSGASKQDKKPAASDGDAGDDMF